MPQTKKTISRYGCLTPVSGYIKGNGTKVKAYIRTNKK